jgi:hypothetical protein
VEAVRLPGAGELHHAFDSTEGGVLTVDVGVITGALELLTKPSPAGDGIEAMVRYAGATELYTVEGSPVRSVSETPDESEHAAAHERILAHLTTPGPVRGGNEQPLDLR